MDSIMAIAAEYGLAVIEDTCQSHGAEYKDRRVGNFGIGCFSLYPTKNITSAEGGMITTNDATYLNAHLRGVITPETPPERRHVFHQYTLRVKDGRRDALVEHLQKNGVGSGIYYPVPIHQQTYYVQELGYNVRLPEAERAAAEVISLPVHPALSQADLETIVVAVNQFTKE